MFDDPASGGAGGSGTGLAGGPGAVGVVQTTPVALASPNVLLAVAAVVGALLIGGVALVIGVSGSGGGAVEGPPTSSDAGATESLPPQGGGLVIDVAGAVAQPGLYHLPIGSRVGDAVDAAGGFGPRVDVDRVGQELNLAETLTDGQQVRVPSRDDPATASGGGASGNAAGTGGSGSGSGGGAAALVNLNSATQAELEALPGIGPVTATKIIAAREETPFRSVDELRDRGLVGEKTFGQLQALVSVK